MCGLAGYLGAPVPEGGERALLERMIRTLAHRGPDGYGFHVEPGVGLAHARLSIIDLATGDQPIHNPARTVWTVFNGEIFNYVELRRELEAEGRVFYTRSDTEVIVHLYDRDGDRFVISRRAFASLDGMEKARRVEVTLARSRVAAIKDID
ncbi:MAG TPA: asparagine synthetase B, partial [Luteimonas sp.]|nr:asparagine synthetase B [Luteimonas sp.]